MTARLVEFAGSVPEPDGGAPSGSVCIDNIGAKGRQVRWRFGWVAFAFGVALAAALVLAGADRW